ncbi:MAG: ABC transporter permease [Planctomycetota bacterium]|jgi:ABC-type transport system involved in multi-copper enzyme maturation permease subunit
MQALLSKLGLWFWHLVPANPIVVRVVLGASRRPRHLWLRFAYLSILVMVVLIALIPKTSGGGSLSDLAKGASATFKWASITQLALMCFLAPIFTAGAITQEKDAQTFNILLSTPLSNAQIVFGSLLSRLYFVIMLLAAGLPIFFITMVYGGVTASQIVESFAIAGGTAVLTGSLAIAISMIRVGTRRTIFSFYLMIGLYLLALYFLGLWRGTWIDEAPASIGERKLSWLAAYHPFLALEVALNRIPAPEIGRVASAGWPTKYFYAYPQTVYVVLTLGLSLVLTVLSMFFVRRGAKEGESSFLGALAEKLGRPTSGQRTRKPRRVWANPVAWREAVTRAAAANRGLMRYVLLAGGAVAAILLLWEYGQSDAGFGASETREWLMVMVMIEFGIVLLVSANTAATGMTKERESNTMDLLLTSPLTSRYIIWGKLRGLVSFTVPMIAVPVASVLLFAIYDLFATEGVGVAYLEAAVELAALMLVFTAATCMLGLHFSLRSKRTVRAVMVTLGTMILLLLAATAIGMQLVGAFGAGGAVVAPFTPFTAIQAICDPGTLVDQPSELAGNMSYIRGLALVGSALSTGVVVLIVASMYKSMVRNFDMTIRKQTASG